MLYCIFSVSASEFREDEHGVTSYSTAGEKPSYRLCCDSEIQNVCRRIRNAMLRNDVISTKINLAPLPCSSIQSYISVFVHADSIAMQGAAYFWKRQSGLISFRAAQQHRILRASMTRLATNPLRLRCWPLYALLMQKGANLLSPPLLLYVRRNGHYPFV